MVKIAILSFEHVHAPGYAQALQQLPEAQFVAFADDNAARRKRVEKMYPRVRSYSSWKALLKREDCQAVIVTSANVRHAEMVVAAAAAGKHILCDKPIATRITDAEKMIAAAQKHGVKFMIAFPVRYSAAIKRAKQIISAGDLGEIYAIKTTNQGYYPGSWFADKRLAGGGAIMDHTVHCVDLLRYLMEEEIVEVYAESATKLNPLRAEDCGLIMMRMQRGAFASLDTSWSRPKSYKTWGGVTLAFKGSRGNLFIDCFPTSMDVYQNETLPAQAGMRHTSYSMGDDMDLYMVKDFVRAIESGGEVPITGEDGLRALEVAIAAYSSIAKRQPVKLHH
jgi:predicted dehydrogenase